MSSRPAMTRSAATACDATTESATAADSARRRLKNVMVFLTMGAMVERQSVAHVCTGRGGSGRSTRTPLFTPIVKELWQAACAGSGGRPAALSKVHAYPRHHRELPVRIAVAEHRDLRVVGRVAARIGAEPRAAREL